MVIVTPKKNIIDEAAVFRISGAADFLWSEFDDASIVYDPRSGHTQVLNEFARELFSLIEDGPKSMQDLFVEFEKIFETELDMPTKEKIIETVREFDKMGLIDPV